MTITVVKQLEIGFDAASRRLYSIVIWKSDRKRPLERRILRWEYNIWKEAHERIKFNVCYCYEEFAVLQSIDLITVT